MSRDLTAGRKWNDGHSKVNLPLNPILFNYGRRLNPRRRKKPNFSPKKRLRPYSGSRTGEPSRANLTTPFSLPYSPQD
jgi:hypothetical protein